MVAVNEGSLGGMTGRPLKALCAAGIVVLVVACGVEVVVVVRFFELRYGRMFNRW